MLPLKIECQTEKSFVKWEIFLLTKNIQFSQVIKAVHKKLLNEQAVTHSFLITHISLCVLQYTICNLVIEDINCYLHYVRNINYALNIFIVFLVSLIHIVLTQFFDNFYS